MVLTKGWHVGWNLALIQIREGRFGAVDSSWFAKFGKAKIFLLCTLMKNFRCLFAKSEVCNHDTSNSLPWLLTWLLVVTYVFFPETNKNHDWITLIRDCDKFRYLSIARSHSCLVHICTCCWSQKSNEFLSVHPPPERFLLSDRQRSDSRRSAREPSVQTIRQQNSIGGKPSSIAPHLPTEQQQLVFVFPKESNLDIMQIFVKTLTGEWIPRLV